MWRSQVPLLERVQTVEIDSPSGQTDDESGGSAPQSVGAHAASVFVEVSADPAEPGPAAVELGWLPPHANRKHRPSKYLVMR
jgi:hypothetical protein